MDLKLSEWIWTGFIWLNIRTGGRLLWRLLWTFRFHKRQGISWLAEQLLASEEGLCSMNLVNFSNHVHLSSQHVTFSGCGWRIQYWDVEGSCEHIEQVVVHSW
jgi:hypothetical protein